MLLEVTREYGPATLNVEDSSCSLFKGVDHSQVWMSHGDKLHALPTGFKVVATSDNSPFAAISNEKENIFGIQFHPEVTHTKQGKVLLRNFAIDICQASNNWTMENFIDTEIARIQKLVGPTAEVIGAVSGGVDSTVGAKIMKEAIGDRFHAIYVDNGLMRLNETEQVYKTLTEGLGINLTVVDATDLFWVNYRVLLIQKRRERSLVTTSSMFLKLKLLRLSQHLVKKSNIYYKVLYTQMSLNPFLSRDHLKLSRPITMSVVC